MERKISINVFKSYDVSDDFERRVFLEAYVMQLRVALSDKTNKLNDFGDRFNELKHALKEKYPTISRMITYKENLEYTKRKKNIAVREKEKAETLVLSLQMDLAIVRAENRILKIKLEK